MYSSIKNVSAQQLRRAADIKERIESLQTEFNQILGSPVATFPSANDANQPQKRTMSAAARARIAAGARARWARLKGTGDSNGASQPYGRTRSAAVKARLSAIAKARWRKARAAGKTSL